MSGLDKIIEQIKMQAEAEASDIIKSASEYCDAYMEEVKNHVNEEVKAYNKKALAKRNLYTEKVHSGADFRQRNRILVSRQQCINQVIDAAKDRIAGLSDEEYFKLLEKILESNVCAEAGVMRMGRADLDRLPKDFEGRVNTIAQKHGGTLSIDKEAAPMKDGFILVYGEIEENCTMKALFDTNIDRIKDIVNRELFG